MSLDDTDLTFYVAIVLLLIFVLWAAVTINDVSTEESDTGSNHLNIGQVRVSQLITPKLYLPEGGLYSIGPGA